MIRSKSFSRASAAAIVAVVVGHAGSASARDVLRVRVQVAVPRISAVAADRLSGRLSARELIATGRERGGS
jgi:hypothetical protein